MEEGKRREVNTAINFRNSGVSVPISIINAFSCLSNSYENINPTNQ